MALLEANNLVKYFGGLAAVKDVSFKVKKGEIFGLIGPNGSGKTTLFNLITNNHPVTSGNIYFKGQEITGLKPHQICRLGIGRTFQTVKPLAAMTVLDNVTAAAFPGVRTKHQAHDIALKTLKSCRLAHRKNDAAASLPIGERKRLEIARAVATQPELLLLDETVAGLNPTERDAAMELIIKLRNSGVTILIVEHIMKVIMSISSRVHAINFGRSIAEGTPREVANHPAVVEAYLGEAYTSD